SCAFMTWMLRCVGEFRKWQLAGPDTRHSFLGTAWSSRRFHHHAGDFVIRAVNGRPASHQGMGRSIMSHRTSVSLAASVIMAIACLATVPTDAFARRGGGGYHGGGVHHAGAHRGGVYRGRAYRGAAVRRGVAVDGAAAGAGAGPGPRRGWHRW